MSALRKILVVDDDPVVGKSFDRVLHDKGYIVITAENGADALAKLQAERPDVVFTDIRMPGMSGLEVAERVKARQPWTPVVIVTGYGSRDNEARARAAGVSDFLQKPLSPEMIEASAARALSEAEAAPVVAAEIAATAVEAEAIAEEPVVVAKRGRLANMALFLMAPFVGLLYAVLLPFVGLGMLAWVAAEPLLEKPRVRSALKALRFGAMLVAAPFAGLAALVLFPFVGLGLLAWEAGKAIVRPAAE